MRVGQNRRRDSVEAEIVAALKAVGVLVFRISAPGLPDLLTWYRGVWRPMEIKRARGSLTPAQCLVYAQAPFAIVTSIDEAYVAVGVVRRPH